MKIAHSLKMFVGSVAVYAAVASAYACGDANQTAKPGHTAAASGGDGGASGASATGGEDSTSESVGAGPVPSAMADPVPGTRLQSRYRVADDGSKEWIGWYDSELDVDCEWHSTTDGRTRCVPVGFYTYGEAYADAECSVRVGIGQACGPDIGTRYAYEIEGCSVYRTYTIGNLQEGTQLYQFTGGSCSQVAGRLSTVHDRKLVAEVSPSEFVASDVVHGP